MIKDSWKNITLVCGNHGDDYSHEMYLKQGPESLFYACPEYKSIYGKYNLDDRSCNNRLTLVDFERMLEQLNKVAYSNLIEQTPMEGYSFKLNGVSYKVIKHEKGKFTVAMLNKRAIAK